MNSDIPESRPRTRNAPATEFETDENAGTAFCPKLKDFYQAA